MKYFMGLIILLFSSYSLLHSHTGERIVLNPLAKNPKRTEHADLSATRQFGMCIIKAMPSESEGHNYQMDLAETEVENEVSFSRRAVENTVILCALTLGHVFHQVKRVPLSNFFSELTLYKPFILLCTIRI